MRSRLDLHITINNKLATEALIGMNMGESFEQIVFGRGRRIHMGFPLNHQTTACATTAQTATKRQSGPRHFNGRLDGRSGGDLNCDLIVKKCNFWHKGPENNLFQANLAIENLVKPMK
jgi:hypothetical protein